VVDLGFLGDTVHLLPSLWELKRAYPKAELHVLTSAVGSEVLSLVKCVDRSWTVELDPAKRTGSQQWDLVRALRRERFDVAFNFSGADRTIFMTALTGARWRVAHPGGRRHFWNRWLIPEWAPRQDQNLVVYEQRRRVLQACGLKLEPPKFGLQIDEAASKWAAPLVPEWAIHISPCSAKATREWPLEHHAKMLRFVWETSPELRVIISSGPKERERERLRKLAEMVKDPRLQVLEEAPSIARLAALLSRCRLHIGPDSGVLHLAVALGVPTISFFREQGAYKSFMPVGPRHQVISVPCHCIDHHHAPCEPLGRAECFEQITPARVASLVGGQLRAR
jgi:ADP-heptose:LPS heptosyltransferase